MLLLLHLFLKISRVVCIIWFRPCPKFCSLCVRGSREHVELLSQDPEEEDWGWNERLRSEVLASLPDSTMDLLSDATPFPWSWEGACLMPCTAMTVSSREEFFVDCSCLHKLTLPFTWLLGEGQPESGGTRSCLCLTWQSLQPWSLCISQPKCATRGVLLAHLIFPTCQWRGIGTSWLSVQINHEIKEPDFSILVLKEDRGKELRCPSTL